MLSEVQFKQLKKKLLQQFAEDPTLLMSPGHHVRQIRVPGDIIIGGVFPVHTKSVAVDHPCGVIAETR